MKKWDIAPDLTEIKGIVRDYDEQLYSKQLDKLEEMGKFLETHNQPKLNHEEIKSLNRLVTIEETESVIKILPIKRSPG